MQPITSYRETNPANSEDDSQERGATIAYTKEKALVSLALDVHWRLIFLNCEIKLNEPKHREDDRRIYYSFG